jgi:hypothetical protein
MVMSTGLKNCILAYFASVSVVKDLFSMVRPFLLIVRCVCRIVDVFCVAVEIAGIDGHGFARKPRAARKGGKRYQAQQKRANDFRKAVFHHDVSATAWVVFVL